MEYNKRELLETMIELLGEDEIRSILKTVIQDKSKQLSKLQQLSLKLSGNSVSTVNEIRVYDSFEELENDTASVAVLRILKEATKPMSNSDIRKQYYQLFGKEMKASTIGNALWKGQKEKLFAKIGSKGTRYTKWRYVHQDD